MKRGNLLTLLICFILVFSVIPVGATTDSDASDEKVINIIQPRFTNISVFYNDFYITDQGKAVLISSIDARNVDECKISMYLQKYQNGSWVTVKHWSARESGTFCGLGEIWYVMGGYQYRMVSYAYTYSNGIMVESTYYTSPSIILE
jgi:uncharacterized protein YdaL